MRDRVLALLKRYGWNATAFQTLGESFDYWFDGDDACVAYCATPGAWVVAGAPLCDPARLAEVSARFVAAAQRAGKRVCFFGVEDRFIIATGYEPMVVGEQPVWNPADWSATVQASKNLREQLRRAKAKQVVVRQLSVNDDLTAVHALREQSQRKRPMAPMGFLVSPADETWANERRSFVAEQNGAVVGFLAAAPVYARKGFLVEEFIRLPTAPNGTIELLIDAAMRSFATDGTVYATLGLAPLSGDIEPWLKTVSHMSRGLYDFGGLQRFKARLNPQRWDTISLAVPPGGSLMLALYDTLRAFARGRLFSFGLKTLLRVPDVVVRLLGVLLVPWTLALLAADTEHWFPAHWVHHAWVGFDVALALCLLSLARKWRPWLGLAVCVAVSADALLTTLQAVTWNLPRLATAWEAVAVVVACLAPSSASVLLWRAWLNRR